ncbi:acyltransferase family domain-containing protein [Ditylenchus destructor]|uniref:Acyltransferase family domain-containing protein n=1 Tax=Ditylenchus destructor TaxID=166010 RepID=A0AAD4MNX0_9BILA|nr:acyltransferase family domain-containing protein [Ditylenchus destructor]
MTSASPKVADCSIIDVPQLKDAAVEAGQNVTSNGVKSQPQKQSARLFCFDLIRVFACYMVVQSHSGLQLIRRDVSLPNFTEIEDEDKAEIENWFNHTSICRADVPLFMMVSGYFLFPVKNAVVFFKRRFSRVLIPFAVWSLLYALLFLVMGIYDLPTTLLNFPKMLVRYVPRTGHLWFIYSLLGIYLYAPILSPWVQSTSQRMMELYLTLWSCSLTLPYLNYFFPHLFLSVDLPMLHYFSGNIGYFIMSSYLKRFHSHHKTLHCVLVGLGMTLLGYSLTVAGWLFIPRPEHIYKVVIWQILTPNVVLMAVGLFIFIRAINWGDASTSPIHWLVSDVANKSYGIYLSHMIIIYCSCYVVNMVAITFVLKLPLYSVTVFVLNYLMCKLISYLPKSNYIIG